MLLGGRPLPERLGRVTGLLAPALLAALVAINTFETERALVLDERALGVGAAAVAIWLKAPPLLVVAVAATSRPSREPCGVQPMTRYRDLGLSLGLLPPGTHNAITDVPGVRVGVTT